MILFVAVLAMLLAFAAPTAAITNGAPDGDNHPYVGILVFDIYNPDLDANVPAWRCSGSLISEDVVLTAGHCTDGAVAARVWFDERLQDDDGTFLVPDYPFGGGPSIEGTPYTNPDFAIGAGNGLPGFAFRDVGVVVLEEGVAPPYAVLPDAGVVDDLRNKTDLDLVGYGVQEPIHIPGDGAPFWTGLRNRLFAPAELVSGKFKHSDEFIKVSGNTGGGTGGTCFGDSGGPTLLANTDTVLAVTSYGANGNCAGVGYNSRVDIPEVLDWIASF
jgi:hypothetical protein